MLVLSFAAGKYLGADYAENTSIVFMATGQNFEQAIAMAIVCLNCTSRRRLPASLGR